MLPYDKLISFNEYSRITKEEYDSLIRERFNPLEAMQTSPFEKDEDDMLKLIFAPDPCTGLPRSDLAIMLSKDSAPEVARYIQETLQRPLHDSGPASAPDADTALDTMRNRSEDFVAYAERLRELASSYSKSDSK